MGKGLFWITMALILLIVVVLVSGIFYFNFFAGIIGTGHVVFNEGNETGDSDIRVADDKRDVPVIEGDVIFEEINKDSEE